MRYQLLLFRKTNLADDPGRVKIICKRGCKYPERNLNSSKSANSIMVCASASGNLLPYVTYMYNTWTIGGPPKCRFNRSESSLKIDSLKMLTENNSEMVLLSSNSTHLAQPLDLSFFRPFKVSWRKILIDYRTRPARKESGIPKDIFPRLLEKLMQSIEEKQLENTQPGFLKCEIYPFNP